MKLIQLTQGFNAIVDDDDFEWLSKFKWFASKHRNVWYAKRATLKNGMKTSVFMHRQILNVAPGLLCDHRNNDGLDNRKHNLRVANHSQNTSNASFLPRGTFRNKNKWRAQIQIGRINYHLGAFNTEEEAHEAYKRKKMEIAGDFSPFYKKDSLELT